MLAANNIPSECPPAAPRVETSSGGRPYYVTRRYPTNKGTGIVICCRLLIALLWRVYQWENPKAFVRWSVSPTDSRNAGHFIMQQSGGHSNQFQAGPRSGLKILRWFARWLAGKVVVLGSYWSRLRFMRHRRSTQCWSLPQRLRRRGESAEVEEDGRKDKGRSRGTR